MEVTSIGGVQIIGIEGLPVIEQGDNLASLICSCAGSQGIGIQEGDVLVVTHVIVSRVEGRTVDLNEMVPSEFAQTIAEESSRDPALVEVVLQEARRIVRMEDGKLITETPHGLVCANSGVDRSNVPGKRTVALLPEDADQSAKRLRENIKKLTECNVAVIVADTHGRPLRRGEVNIALGVAGISPIRDRRGEKDLFGYRLRVKHTAVVDELASAAELVMGQSDEGVPVAIIRGYDYPPSGKVSSTELIRSQKKDLFL